MPNFGESQEAIQAYMNYRAGNEHMHTANVSISAGGGNLYNGTAEVKAGIETNDSFVEIFGDAQFDKDFYTRYSNKYQQFEFDSGTLIIEGQDKKGNSITIEISAV